MNNGQKKELKKYLKKPTNQNKIQGLRLTISPDQQEAAYSIIKGILVDLGVSTGPKDIEKQMKDAVKEIKKLLKLPTLEVRPPTETVAAATVLDKSQIVFLDPVQEKQKPRDFYFTGRITQGNNPKDILYKLQECSIGLAVAHEPILKDFFACADSLSGNATNLEKELKRLAEDSLKHLPLAKGKGKEGESTRYLAAGRMELQCTVAEGDDPVSFFVVSCGQNCDKDLVVVGNEYHGEAFIYGAFLDMLKILDLSKFHAVKVVIDYKASTPQQTACTSCTKLLPRILSAMRSVVGVSELIDNY